MGTIHFVKVAAHLVVTLRPDALARASAASPRVVGEELAHAVDAYARRERLGYYPALGFFREVGGVDEDLLDAAANLAWLAGELAREEVRSRLRQVFSRVDVESVQPVAFTLPGVRPERKDSLARLARHYTPDTVKLSAVLTSLHKQASPAGIEQFVRRTLWRWLRERFADLDVTGARLV